MCFMWRKTTLKYIKNKLFKGVSIMKNLISCKNNSRFSKVFFSMALILALFASSIIPTMAEGETVADFGGYDTKYTHVYSPMDLITTGTSPKIKPTLYNTDTKEYVSSVWKLSAVVKTVDGEEQSTLMKSPNRLAYDDGFTADTAPNKAYIAFANNDVFDSVYKFYCSSREYSATTQVYQHRTIEYVCKLKGEHMALGFTAPVSGTYEIAAPIERITGEGLVKFGITKNNIATLSTDLQELGEEIGSKGRFSEIIELEAGETAWLNARFAGKVTIDIGIPKAILLKDEAVVTNADDTTTYKFRAFDYLDNKALNNFTYLSQDTDGNHATTTENAKAAWEVGYICDDATTTNGLTYTNLTALNKMTNKEEYTSQELEALIAAMKPYDLLVNGLVYVGSDFRHSDASTAIDLTVAKTTATGMFFPTIKMSDNVGNGLTKSYSPDSWITTRYIAGLHNTYKKAGGHYYRFNAPVAGTAKVSLGDNITLTNLNLVVLHNSEVKYITDTVPENAYEFNVNAGDEITLLYYSTKNANAGEIGCPEVELTTAAAPDPVYATISYDANGGVVVGEYEEQALVGSTVKFPQAEKENAVFKGWYDYATDTAYPYPREKEVVITGDVTFTARYNYFGDITGDRILNEDDLAMYRRYLLDLEALPDLAFSEPDANRDGNVDICDLVCTYKLLQKQ